LPFLCRALLCMRLDSLSLRSECKARPSCQRRLGPFGAVVSGGCYLCAHGETR